MRRTPWDHIDKYRVRQGRFASTRNDNFGAFIMPSKNAPKGTNLRIIASTGDPEVPWEHVSVSLEKRCPTWDEMAYVKDLFWLSSETVMQLHVPQAEHKNLHPFTLHLWRPWHVEIPRPPSFTVAP
jgi:hypothetical protein